MRKRHKDEGGAAAVEFGMILPLFALLLFGLIQFGWYFWTAETTNSSAREVARRIVVGDCWNAATRTTFAAKHARGLVSVSVNPEPPGGLKVGDKVTVTVVSNSAIIGFVPGIPGTVTRTYDARMEVDAATTPDRCS